MSDISHLVSIFEHFSDSLNLDKTNFINPSIWDNINDSIRRVYRIESLLGQDFKIPEKQPLFPIINKSGSFAQLNDPFVGYKILDVIKVEFNRFYPNIICRLYEEGILDVNIKNEPYYCLVKCADRIKPNLSESGRRVFNLYINYFFGLKLSLEEKNNVVGRGYQIIENFSTYEGWLYSDTDEFFIKDDINLIDNLKKDLDLLEIPYEIDIIKEIVLLGRKKYTYIDHQGMGKIFGFHKKTKK